jgi:hypothetical protein
MADFTILDSGQFNSTVATSRDTTNAITPAVGDLCFFSGAVSVGTGAALTGGGMSWTLVQLEANSDNFVAAFRAVSGTPSSGVLTFSASDNFRDHAYAVIRPVDLDYVGVAGSNNSAGSSVDTLTIPLTTSSPAGLLAYCAAAGTVPTSWAVDPGGWAEILDAFEASGASHQVQERFSDDTEVICDAAINARITGVCLEFDAAGSSVNLVVQDGAIGLAAEVPSLTQANILAVQDAAAALGAESPALTQANTLAIQDALIALAAESPTLEVGGITLTVQDGAIALAAETPALTQAHLLVVADAAVALAAESPSLTQANILAVADAAIALAAENPGLTQAHVLAVQDGAIALTVDPVTLSLSALLEIADAAIALVSDGVALTQANQLAVADALISLAAENPALIQAHILSVNGVAIALVADNIALLGLWSYGTILSLRNVGVRSASLAATVQAPTLANVEMMTP